MDNLGEEINDIKIETNERFMQADNQFEQINRRLDILEARLAGLTERSAQRPVHRPFFIFIALIIMGITLLMTLRTAPSRRPEQTFHPTPVSVPSGQVISSETVQNPIKPEMVFIKGGTYQMGESNNKWSSKRLAHNVTVSDFYTGKYDVTNKEYVLFLNARGNQTENGVKWWFGDSYKNNDIYSSSGTFSVKSGCENLPVVWVTWNGSVAYCNWLSEEEGLSKCYGDINNRGNADITKKGYRLPSEAEWEYACRGGTKTDYFWGNGDWREFCWYRLNSDNHPHEVGQKKPNPYGLFDMNGNVWQWCSDWYGDYPPGSVTNPAGPSFGTHRSVRGGCFANDPCGSSAGMPHDTGSRDDGFAFGFRLVRSK